MVTLPTTNDSVCPVRAARRYLDHTTGMAPDEPLLLRASGASVTVAWLNSTLSRHLPTSAGRITTHSLHIGFAAAAAAAGAPDSAIRAAGRWAGAASHLRYIRGCRVDVWNVRLAAGR